MKGILKHTKKGWGISYTDTKTKEKKFIKLHPNDLEQLLKQSNPSDEDGKKVEFELGHTEEHGKFPKQIRFTSLSESDMNRLVKKIIKEDKTKMGKKSLYNFSDYQVELEHYLEELKETFNNLIDLREMVMNDNELSAEEKDEITWTIGQTFDDPYGSLLDDDL